MNCCSSCRNDSFPADLTYFLRWFHKVCQSQDQTKAGVAPITATGWFYVLEMSSALISSWLWTESDLISLLRFLRLLSSPLLHNNSSKKKSWSEGQPGSWRCNCGHHAGTGAGAPWPCVCVIPVIDGVARGSTGLPTRTDTDESAIVLFFTLLISAA